MKTRNLFLSLFAFAAICACNKEAQPETPAVLENDAYVSVSIVAPGSVSTRGTSGDTDYVVGSAEENEITNAKFIFFNGDGSFNQIATPSLSFKDHNQSNPFVEKVSEATVILKATDITPTQMLVVLNAPNDLDLGNKSLSEVKVLTGNYSTGFVMTNSVYTNAGIQASAITDNIKKSAAEALANPVEVYVERVVAKVTVDDDSWTLKNDLDEDVTSLNLPLNVHAGTSATWNVKPVIVGYGLTNLAEDSYLYKSVDGWNIDNWVYDAQNFRSYWATSSATSYTTHKYQDFALVTINADGSTSGSLTKSFYCLENTTSEKLNKTSLIVDVQFVDATTNKPIETFYKCETDYYTEDGLKALAVQMLKGAGLTTYTTSDIEIVENAKASLVKVLTTDHYSAAESALSTMANVKKWDGGKAYYYTNIEHFGKDKSSNELVGVVRNHVYELTIKSIKGFGGPIGGGGEVVVPDTPEDAEYENLAATVKILQWKVVNQNVNLQ